MSQRELQSASVETLLDTAKGIVEQTSARCSLFDPEDEALVLRFEKEEIFTGRVVGRGGFAVVQEITGFSLPGDDSIYGSKGSKSSSRGRSNGRSRSGSLTGSGSRTSSLRSLESDVTPDLSTKELMASNCQSSSGRKPRFVCKSVNKCLFEENKFTYLKGIVDLAMEAKYLASLSHPHILELRGMSSHGMFASDGPFLILDRLSETLPKALKDWMTRDRACKGVTGVFVGGKKKTLALLVERLRVAFDLASALLYLHNLSVVYRDLKPDNIGFDSKGRVRIFDFGLAKQLRKDELMEDGLYNLTGFTGSIRYMAPEVGRKEHYNEKADVYSFSMLLWYMMALEPPYGFYTDRMFIERVFGGGSRPVTQDAWPEQVSNLLAECWAHDLSQRPSFKDVMTSLRTIVASVDPPAAELMTQ